MNKVTDLVIIVVVPSGTHWLADFATSLIMMVSYVMNKQVPGCHTVEIRVMNIKGSLLSTSRLQGIKAAKKLNATHLLFLDCDHVFPADLFHQLIFHDKDVIAANCTTKQIPANTTARLYDPNNAQGIPVYSDVGIPRLQQVWRVGTGVMLLTSKAFNQLPYDCFTVKYMPDRMVYQGEDWMMCEALEKAGVPIYVDHALSRQVGHLGIMDYGHDLVGVVQKEEVKNVA